MPGEVFISYARSDEALRDGLRAWIEAQGWLPIADQDIPQGADWDRWIRSAIADARCVIFLWTEHSIVSEFVRHEFMLAREQSKEISLIIGSVSPLDLPLGAASRQVLKIQGLDDRNLTDLRSQITAHCGEPLISARLRVIRLELEKTNSLSRIAYAVRRFEDHAERAIFKIVETAQLSEQQEQDIKLALREELRALEYELHHEARAQQELAQRNLTRIEALEEVILKKGL